MSLSRSVQFLALVALLCGYVFSQRPHHGQNLVQYESFLKAACGLDRSGNATVKDRPFSDLFGYAIGASSKPVPSEDKLVDLAAKMDERLRSGARFDDPNIPAGLIFFGQFIDHDVTFDIVSQLSGSSDPATIENVRTPRLDLDSVYLDGPEASPFLYDTDHHGHLLVGTESNPLDLPRNDQGTALIGDPRNDENSVIAQLHLLFIRFHNAVLTDVESGVFDGFRGEDEEDDFEFAQRIVRWHYQWIVDTEFLPAVIQPKVLEAIRKEMGKGGWCRKGKLPALPIEFSAAAYRFGHSQIRGEIRVQRGGPIFPLFDRSGGGLTSFAPIPTEHVIDWSLFFRSSLAHPQPARKLDAFLVQELFDLPFEEAKSQNAILASRNLRRGAITFHLSTGEEVLKFINEKTGANLPGIKPNESVEEVGLKGQTPLWFYCLDEAGQGGGKLGPVGGSLVGLTLLRMLTHDPLSYLADEEDETVKAYYAREQILARLDESMGAKPKKATPKTRSQTDWKPFLGPKRGEFSMGDLVRYVLASEGR